MYVISSDTHKAYDFLLTIFFSQMIQQLYDFADKSGGRLKVPAFFILDEFANIGQIPDFDKKISTSRSRGISLVLYCKLRPIGSRIRKIPRNYYGKL